MVEIPKVKPDPDLPPATPSNRYSDLDLKAMLEETIHQLHAEMLKAQGSRKGPLSQAEIAAMKQYKLMFPATVDEFVDSLLEVPNFSPQEFARVLKERYAKQ